MAKQVQDEPATPVVEETPAPVVETTTTPEPETVPEAVPETPAVVSPPAAQVRLTLVAPWLTSVFNAVTASGDKLAIDRKGVMVDASAADEIVAQAKSSSVYLRVGK